MEKNKKILTAVFAAALLIALFFFLIAAEKPVVLNSGRRRIMGTFASVTAVAENTNAAKKCIQAAFRQFEDIENLLSYHKADSELSNINHNAYPGPLKLSQTAFDVIERAVVFSELTGGAFDVTVAPLVDLWQSAADANAVPGDAELADARSKVGYEKLILDVNENTIRFAEEGMKIDLGGIAKGYAIDKAVEAMKNAGAVGAMVDIGGDIRVFGRPPKGKKYWHIGVQDPRDAENYLLDGSYMLVLRLQNSAVATSGDYRRFALIKGQKHSHIIDTQTGQTSSRLSSVTVITENAVKADALATAVSVLGAEKGIALIEKIPQAEAILLSAHPEYKLIKSTGGDKYIKVVSPY
ncbi:FAD:protein FMN transferase [Planctomycetota bacterium]